MIRANFIILAMLACMPLRSQVQQFFTSDSLALITSPLDLDSLFYWFDAGAGVTDSLGGAIATDEGVGTWNDQSGNGWHATQTTNTDRPVYKATGGPGSKPCIQFDGTDDYLKTATHFWGSDDMTMIVVGKYANATRNVADFFFEKGDATGDKRQLFFYGGITSESYAITQVSYRDGTTPNYVTYKGDAKTTNYRAYSFVNNGAGTTTLHIDGVSKTVTRGVGGTGNDTILDDNTSSARIGSNAAANTFLQGSISEIIVYAKALTATERAAIENYLNKKYDLY